MDLAAVGVGTVTGYLVAALVPGGDAVIPLLPGETVMITIGLLGASTHDPRVLILLLLGIVSAWVGDQVSYVLGRRFGEPLIRRYARGDRGEKTLEWARTALAERAAVLLVLARFIPGGRTALTLTAGSTGYDVRRFRLFTAIAAALWGTYSAGLGFLGGKSFKDNHLLALGVALAGGFAITGLIEAGRWVGRRRASAHPGRG